MIVSLAQVGNDFLATHGSIAAVVLAVIIGANMRLPARVPEMTDAERQAEDNKPDYRW